MKLLLNKSRMIKCSILILGILFIFSCKKQMGYSFNFYTPEYYLNKKLIQKILKTPVQQKIKINSLPKNIFPVSGTVSHHLLTAKIINEWFKTLKKTRDINTFIIISPKHFNTDNNIICLSSLPWKLENINIETNKKYVQLILSRMNLEEERSDFQYEHGIGAFIFFIHEYYPNANIVPIIMDEFNKQITKCYNLADIIADIMKKDKSVFLLLSVDFSHHGDLITTINRDRESEKVLYNLNKSYVNSAYSDNNVGIITLFKVLEELENHNNFLFCHTNSNSFGNIDNSNLTSYFFTYQY